MREKPATHVSLYVAKRILSRQIFPSSVLSFIQLDNRTSNSVYEQKKKRRAPGVA